MWFWWNFYCLSESLTILQCTRECLEPTRYETCLDQVSRNSIVRVGHLLLHTVWEHLELRPEVSGQVSGPDKFQPLRKKGESTRGLIGLGWGICLLWGICPPVKYLDTAGVGRSTLYTWNTNCINCINCIYCTNCKTVKTLKSLQTVKTHNFN